MTFPAGCFQTAVLLLASLVVSGCLPSAPRDEEKEPHYLAGKSRVNKMDFEGAIESFEKAVEVNPRSASAHFELGWLYDQKAPDPAAAIYHYERYLKLLPNSGKEEMVNTRVQACKQQLAQTVSLGPVTEKQQREFEKLVDENKRLRDEIEKWRAYALPLSSLTNQARPVSAAPRVTPPTGYSLPAATGSASAERSPTTLAPTTRTHIVRAGENPGVIARKYGVKLDMLMAANPTLDARRLRVGQAVVIPGPKPEKDLNGRASSRSMH